MEIHLVKELVKFATAFLTLRLRFIVHFLQNLNNFFALFTLVFINGHDSVLQFIRLSVYYNIFR